MSKLIRNQNQKIIYIYHPKPKISTVARLVIQGYAERPQYRNLLPQIKRGGSGGGKRRRERGKERGRREKRREGEGRGGTDRPSA